MIYTVTLNPSLDYIVHMEELRLGEVNRSRGETVLPGGKGINVSVVLKNLGIDSVALGFAAGFVGDEIECAVRAAGCNADFIRVQGVSRINLKLKAREETEVNGRGPAVTDADIGRLKGRLCRLGRGDILVLAGSAPAPLLPDVYGEILSGLAGGGVRVVVDAEGELLQNALPYRPFLIKPNHHELGELFGRELRGAGEIAEHARRLQGRGARNVLVSMAGEGAVLAAEDGWAGYLPAPHGTVKNSTGAGDSMVAGFLAGLMETGSLQRAFCMGVAAGSASAFSEGLATREQIEEVLRGVGKVRTV